MRHRDDAPLTNCCIVCNEPVSSEDDFCGYCGDSLHEHCGKTLEDDVLCPDCWEFLSDEEV